MADFKVPRHYTAVQRLDHYSIPEPNSGCFLWLGATTLMGYGNISFQGRSFHAHKLAWLTHRGLVPDGLEVMHKCDVPSCVNPDHLELGTHKQNMTDAKARGRLKRSPELTQEKVREIREKCARNANRVLLAEQYGIGRRTLYRILDGEAWAHVK
jgi:hypothetical protein